MIKFNKISLSFSLEKKPEGVCANPIGTKTIDESNISRKPSAKRD